MKDKMIALVASNKPVTVEGLYHAAASPTRTFCGNDLTAWRALGLKSMEATLKDVHFCAICARAIQKAQRVKP